MAARVIRLGTETFPRIGLGARSLSVEGAPDAHRAIATVHAALDRGVRIIDTSPSYHTAQAPVGDNETLVAQAIASYPGDAHDVLVATKGGVFRQPDGAWRTNGRPDAIRAAVKGSLRRLKVDAIGLYQLHKPDPDVPYAESVGVLSDLLDEGEIRMSGVSNVDGAQIRLARQTLGTRLVSVQNRYSVNVRDADDQIDLCEQLGVAFLAWGPLGGAAMARQVIDSPDVAALAQDRGVSGAAVCLAWVLGRSPSIVALVGATRPATIDDALHADDLVLSDEERHLLGAL